MIGPVLILCGFMVVLLLLLAVAVVKGRHPAEPPSWGPEDTCATDGHDTKPLEGGGTVCLRCCRVWEEPRRDAS